jgi:hypothetical protein
VFQLTSGKRLQTSHSSSPSAKERPNDVPEPAKPHIGKKLRPNWIGISGAVPSIPLGRRFAFPSLSSTPILNAKRKISGFS